MKRFLITLLIIAIGFYGFSTSVVYAQVVDITSLMDTGNISDSSVAQAVGSPDPASALSKSCTLPGVSALQKLLPAASSVATHPDPLSVSNQTIYYQQSSIFFKNCILDGMAQVLAKTIIKSLTGSIVNWINSGFKGNPAFVQNVGAFMGGIADSVAGQYIEGITPQLCSPFRLNIQLALAQSMSGMEDSLSCTLTSTENNILGASLGVSGSGSWSEWFNVTQNAQNNPYGAAMLAGAQMNINIQSSQGKYQKQLDWGKGFLSFEECPSHAEIAAAGSAKAVADAYNANNGTVYGVQVGNNGCVTKTPGAVIQEQLSNTLNSDLRGLELAQSMDQIFAALVGQLVTQALGGVGGLMGH